MALVVMDVLELYNEGLEVHDHDKPFLTYAVSHACMESCYDMLRYKMGLDKRTANGRRFQPTITTTTTDTDSHLSTTVASS